MTGITEDTWVLVADGEKALLLENLADAENPHLQVVRKEEQDNPPDREQGTDRPGRMADGGPSQKTALEETDFHRLQKERFGADLAELMLGYARKGRFRHLVIAASPQILGSLREHLHKEVTDLVVAEVPKTLTNHPVAEIEDILRGTLAEA